MATRIGERALDAIPSISGLRARSHHPTASPSPPSAPLSPPRNTIDIHHPERPDLIRSPVDFDTYTYLDPNHDSVARCTFVLHLTRSRRAISFDRWTSTATFAVGHQRYSRSELKRRTDRLHYLASAALHAAGCWSLATPGIGALRHCRACTLFPLTPV